MKRLRPKTEQNVPYVMRKLVEVFANMTKRKTDTFVTNTKSGKKLFNLHQSF